MTGVFSRLTKPRPIFLMILPFQVQLQGKNLCSRCDKKEALKRRIKVDVFGILHYLKSFCVAFVMAIYLLQRFFKCINGEGRWESPAHVKYGSLSSCSFKLFLLLLTPVNKINENLIGSSESDMIAQGKYTKMRFKGMPLTTALEALHSPQQVPSCHTSTFYQMDQGVVIRVTTP